MGRVGNVLRVVDVTADCIPLVSTATNIVDLFLKCVFIPFLKKETIAASYYYTHLSEKSFVRCIILCIPLLGNITIGIYDFINRRKDQQQKSSGQTPPLPAPASNDVISKPIPAIVQMGQSEPTKITAGDPSVSSSSQVSAGVVPDQQQSMLLVSASSAGQQADAANSVPSAPAPQINIDQLSDDAVRKIGSDFASASKEFKLHKQFVLRAIALLDKPEVLQHLSPELRNNEEVVTAAVTKNKAEFFYAGKFRANKEMALSVLNWDWKKAAWFHESLYADGDILSILYSKAKNEYPTRERFTNFLSKDALKADKNNALKKSLLQMFEAQAKEEAEALEKEIASFNDEAVTKIGSDFANADKKFKASKSFVLRLIALLDEPEVLQHLVPELQNDKEVVIAAVKKNASQFSRAGQFQVNRELALWIIRQYWTNFYFLPDDSFNSQEIVAILFFKIRKEFPTIEKFQKFFGGLSVSSSSTTQQRAELVLRIITKWFEFFDKQIVDDVSKLKITADEAWDIHTKRWNARADSWAKENADASAAAAKK